MARDFAPYWVQEESAPVDSAYELGERRDLVEVPVAWHRDDYPPLAFSPSRQSADEANVFRQWREELEWLCANESGAFVLTMHPQVIGRGHRLAHLREFVAYARSQDDVTFERVGEVAERFR